VPLHSLQVPMISSRNADHLIALSAGGQPFHGCLQLLAARKRELFGYVAAMGDGSQRASSVQPCIVGPDPQTPPVRRILQRVAAGVIECQLMARFATLHFHWPDPQRPLAEPELCRTMTGVGRQEIDRAGEMLGDAVRRATAEGAEAIGSEFGIAAAKFGYQLNVDMT
jgi:hypothetical protein